MDDRGPVVIHVCGFGPPLLNIRCAACRSLGLKRDQPRYLLKVISLLSNVQYFFGGP